MRKLDPIVAARIDNNLFQYTLAESLDENETAKITGSDIDRVDLFRTHWPDLYTWLLLNNEANWCLVNGNELTDVRLILFFELAVNFNNAFSDRIRFVDKPNLTHLIGL